MADSVLKLHAICKVCGGEASRTQRLVNGRPAAWDEPTILIGADESYEARCRRCHRVRNIPRERRRQTARRAANGSADNGVVANGSADNGVVANGSADNGKNSLSGADTVLERPGVVPAGGAQLEMFPLHEGSRPDAGDPEPDR